MGFTLAHPYCPDCGYDLSGLEYDELKSLRCPECGRQVSHEESTRLPIYLRDPLTTSIMVDLIPALLIGLGMATNGSELTIDNLLIVGVLSFLVVLIGTAKVSSAYKAWKGPKPKWSRYRLGLRVGIHATLMLFPLILLFWWLTDLAVN